MVRWGRRTHYGGFGLVQWTPRSKYWDWAVASNLPPREGNSQLARIDYEVDNNIQWIANGHALRYGLSDKYDFSFADFRTNAHGLTVEALTEAFMWNYEGPAYEAGVGSLTGRQQFAGVALSTLDWTGTGGGGGVDPLPTGTSGALPNNSTATQYKYEEGRAEMIYTVKAGDTLSEIAKKHNVAMKDILGVHHLGDWNKLDIGQLLLIPNTKKTERKYNIVKSGENLWKIAGQYGLRVTDVINLNTQLNNPDIIKVGEKIWLA